MFTADVQLISLKQKFEGPDRADMMKKVRKALRNSGYSITNLVVITEGMHTIINDSNMIPIGSFTAEKLRTQRLASPRPSKKSRKNRKPHVQKFEYLSAPIPTDPIAEGYRKVSLGRHDLSKGDIITLSGHVFRVLRVEATDDHTRTKLFVEDTPCHFVLFAGEQYEVYRK